MQERIEQHLRQLGDGLSGSKVRNVLVALKALYRQLLENDELTVNLVSG